MSVLIFIAGLITGVILNIVIDRISCSIAKGEVKGETDGAGILTLVICAAAFEILFLRFGINIVLIKAAVMTAILLVISLIDLKYRIIPDFLVALALITGIIFSFIVKTPLTDTMMGMVVGGGIMFLLALVPGTLGGGDIKLMFAMGAFLGVSRILWALIAAFIIASVISIAYILLKIKGAKDYIPFGPFLSLGSFISLLIFI